MAGGNEHRVRAGADVAAVSGRDTPGYPRPSGPDVGEVVRAAQTELLRAIALGNLHDDPLRHPLEAISTALGAIEAVHKAAGADMEARVGRLANEITCAAVQEREAAKALAEKVISSAGSWSVELLHRTGEEVGERLVRVVQQERAAAERAAYAARIAAYVACLAAAMPFLWQLGVWIGNRLPVPLF